MSTRFPRVFSIVLCTLLMLPDIQSLKAWEFDAFDGERICTDPNTHYTPETYCNRINVDAEADCISLNLLMATGDSKFDHYVREIVACRVKNEIIACISGGKTDDTYMIWDYFYPEAESSRAFEICVHPPYEVSIPDAESDAGKSSDAGSSTIASSSTNANTE